MTTIRKVIPLQTAEVSPNRTRLIAATSQLARDGHILEPGGMDVENFLRTGTILFDHDPKTPVGTPISAALNAGGDLEVEIEWAPTGISAKADEVRGLVKAGVLRAGSVGFDPLDAEPLDPKRPKGGQHIIRSELLELSIVAVPADTGAVVTQRSSDDWKCGASRDLPIEDSDSWDGSAAEASIFEWAGGDDFDPSKARKGFLAYNAAKPKERGSYKLPIAHVVDGRMKVPKGAIRAAASRLSGTDIPEDVKKSAQAVIDHYEEKAGMGEKDKGDRSIKAAILKRGMGDAAYLGQTLLCLAYSCEQAAIEAAIEQDGSSVPQKLAALTKAAADVFLEMTEEEVMEMLKGCNVDVEEDELPDEERSFVAAAPSVRTRAIRQVVAMARAGKSLSATNEKKLSDGQGHLDRAMKHHKAIGEHQTAVASHVDEAKAAQAKADKAHGDLGEALQAAKSEPDKAAEHVARAVKAHKAVGAAHEDVAEAHENATDRIQDAGDSHAAIGRSIKSAQRSMRSVVEGSTPGAEDGDSKDVQTSAGAGESEGSEGNRSADYRRRQADLEALTANLN